MKGRGPIAWLVYAAVRAVIAAMQAFPMNWNLQTAKLLARCWMVLMPRHLDRAIQHIGASYGRTMTPEKIRTLAVLSLESTVMFAIEVLCMPRLINRFTWSQYIEVVNFKELLELMVEGRGLIMVTGHYGSFELMGHLVASFGFRMGAVMRPLDNFYLNRYLVTARRTHGMELMDKKGATAKAEKFLTDGGLLCFIGDQDAGRKGTFVEFFGRPASAYKSIGLLAMHTNRPIVVGYARRRGDTAKYEVGVQRIIHPHEWASRDDPLLWITQAYSTAIEELVRAAPEQYLWMHRRWKSQPRTRTRGSARVPDHLPKETSTHGAAATPSGGG